MEYKRGNPKSGDWDKIQLCAQAMCLEEMRGIHIDEGALWYGQTRHRESVLFDETLRRRTLTVIDEVRQLLQSGDTPPPHYGKHCQSCSLADECQPKLMQKDKSAAYVAALYQEAEDA
nr:CRISPR-associated protein Cas4 [Stenoxybacter acetivorans]